MSDLKKVDTFYYISFLAIELTNLNILYQISFVKVKIDVLL